MGRQNEVRAIRALLADDHGVAAVTGTAGLGKTAIVREVVGPEALWLRGLATLRDQPGAALSLALPSVSGDLERDASHLLRRLAGRRLVLDDAHWADEYTLAVLALVATAARPAATWRTGDPSAPSTLPDRWESLTLGPLRPVDARALARVRRPALSESELQLLLEMADGSPLLIEELAPGPSSSPSLVSALLARLARLPALIRCAVLMVAAADAGLPAEHVGADVGEDLARSGLAVLERDRWWPRHALLQASVLEVVEPNEIRDAHAALAGLFAAEDPATAARHADRAGLSARAVTLAEAALSSAEGLLGKARATIGLADLLESTSPSRAWSLRVAATSDLRSEGAYKEVLAAFEGQPLPTCDDELLAMAHVNLAAAHWELGCSPRALEHAERALALVRGTGSEAELLARAGLAMHQTRIRFDGPAALAHAREALCIAHRRREHIPFARTRVAAALLICGDPGWRAEIDGAVDDAVTHGDEAGERMARETRHLHAFVAGDLATALSDLRVLTDGSRAGWPPPKPRHLGLTLLIELLALESRSVVLAGSQRLLADEPIFSQRSVAVAAGAVAAVDLGRADIAARLLADVEPVDPEEQLVIAWARAELAWATTRKLPASEGGRLSVSNLATHPAVTMAAVADAWRCLEAGAEPPAAPAVALPGFATAIAEVQAIRSLAAGASPEVVDLFVVAADRWKTGSDRRGTLRCQWGAALAAARIRAPDALDRLSRCWQEATSRGSAPIATRASRALRQRGVHMPPFPASSEPPLSAPETQVLRLVAAGLPTEEVAAVLGLQSCTVDDHLHRALDRLHLRHRAEAVCWIAGRG
jgi:DNA-binding CsgD family transcriptional regulator